MFFFGNVFWKKFKKILDKFSVGRNVLEILKKKFSKKHLKKKHFFSKKGAYFFQIKKVLVYRSRKIFFPKKKFFCQRLSVR